MRHRKLEGIGAATLFLLCAAMTAYYLTAGYGAYLDADMASELALARHLADEGTLISSTWLYSTEVRVLSTQLVFTPLMALLGGSWRAVRTVGCLILQAMLAASAYFCGRSLGAKKRWALAFAGLSISACSVVYSQMILIGAYYVPHAVLTNLCVGMAAQIMQMKKGGRRMGVFAALTALCALMGASSIRYLFCATLPMAAAGVWAYLFPTEELAPRTGRQKKETALVVFVCMVSVAGFAVGQKILGRVCAYDAARYGGVRLAAFTSADMAQMIQQALGGLARLMGYSEHSILLSAHGLVSVGALMLPAAAAVLLARALKKAKREGNVLLRFGALTLAMSAVMTALSFVLLEDLYINRYWIPLMTLGAPVMAACLSGEENAPLRRMSAALFAGVVLLSSAMQIKSTMDEPQIMERDYARADYLEENGMTFGYATFWNANVVTELTSGKVEVVSISIDENAEGQGVPHTGQWLEKIEDIGMNHPNESVFILLSPQEAERLKDFLALSGAEKTYEDDGLGVYRIESQRAFFDAAEKLDTP